MVNSPEVERVMLLQLSHNLSVLTLQLRGKIYLASLIAACKFEGIEGYKNGVILRSPVTFKMNKSA